MKRFKKITINTALFYRQSDGNVERIQQETGDLVDLIVDSGTNNPVLQVPVLEYYPINLSTNKRFGSELSITYTPSRSVRINGSFTLNSTKIRGNYLEQSFDSDDTNWYLIKKEISLLDTLIYLIQVGGDQLLQEKHLDLNLKVNGESLL